VGETDVLASLRELTANVVLRCIFGIETTAAQSARGVARAAHLTPS
jgi:hypothetical protein